MAQPLILPRTDWYFTRTFLVYLLLCFTSMVALVTVADLFQRTSDFYDYAVDRHIGTWTLMLMMLKYYLSFAPMLVMAILIPIGAGFALDAAPNALFEQIQIIKAEVDIFNALPNLLVFFAVTALVFGLALPGLIARMKMAE